MLDQVPDGPGKNSKWVASQMRVEPLGENLVVKRMAAEPITAGGIVLPAASQGLPQQGRVLSVGDGRRLPNGARAVPQVQEGDRILFNGVGQTEVLIDDEVIIVNENDVLAVVE